MRVFARILLFLLTWAFVGCVGKVLPGKLYSLQDGTELEFSIETSYGTGRMTAKNPVTGETFEGQYTATLEGGSTTHTQVSTFQPGQPVSRSSMPGQGFTSVSTTAPDSASARGILRGNLGTIIEVVLQIEPGLRPKGHGEGRDNKGQRYQIQF